MKTPRDLYGREFADHLMRHWEYREERQTGSHIILRTGTPRGQTLPIPAHKPMRTGTLAAIVRMVADLKGVSRDDVLRGLWLFDVRLELAWLRATTVFQPSTPVGCPVSRF